MSILRQYVPVWLAAAALFAVPMGCAPKASDDARKEPGAAAAPEIVAGSAHIQAIVRDLSGGTISPRSLIPPAACPGHCDMRPSDVDAVARCKALIIHPWQQTMANAQGAIAASGIGADRIHVADVPGNWMAPAVQAEAVKAVVAILAELTPGGGADSRARAETRAQAVLAYGEPLAQELRQAGAGTVPVLCGEIQSGFVQWAGFDIVSTFERAEDLSVADVEALIRAAREGKAALVIDNLQSGEVKTSAAIARDLGAVHVVLSNFPGGFDGTDTWEQAIRKNVDLLLEAVAEVKQGRG